MTHTKKVERKFVAQIIYGMLKSGSLVLKDIGTALNEPIHIKNTIDRLKGCLNAPLTYAIGLLGFLADKLQTSKLSRCFIHNSKALRENIQFYYYQLAKGILSTLAHAKMGIQSWFELRQSGPRQLEFKLTI